jgi:hypothetical protein
MTDMHEDGTFRLPRFVIVTVFANHPVVVHRGSRAKNANA